MKRRRPIAWLVFSGFACAVAAIACSRADLDAVTRPPAGDGGVDGVAPVTCPSPTPPLQAGDSMQTIQMGSVTRTYLLHVPAIYDGNKPVPLLVDFHVMSPTASGAQERSISPYPAVTDPEGVVMAFPTGLAGPSGPAWEVGPCCVGNVDDVAFVKAVVAQVSLVACIDPKRVYAAGFSMGGGMAHFVACHAADVFAAVAPSAFDLLQENVVDCLPPRPITVISFRGSADMLVPYDGGPSAVVPGMPVTFLGAQATFKKWAQIDQCMGTPSPPDSNGCSTYSSCQAGVEVVLCTKQGGGQELGNAGIAWPVLKRHPLP
jgi:polyhydroxybutyrate depolymerase